MLIDAYVVKTDTVTTKKCNNSIHFQHNLSKPVQEL